MIQKNIPKPVEKVMFPENLKEHVSKNDFQQQKKEGREGGKI